MVGRDVNPERRRVARALPQSLCLALALAALSGCQQYAPRNGMLQPYAQSSYQPYPAPPPYMLPPSSSSRQQAGPGSAMQALSSLARCQEAYRAQQFVEAVTSCNSAVDLNPELADAYDERANAYTWLRDYERAIADYGTVLKLRPSYFYAYNNRGNAYAALGEFDHAIADYGVALRVRPDYAEAYGNRGSAFAAMNDYQRALADYDMALKLKPDDERARQNREQALQRVAANVPLPPGAVPPDASAAPPPPHFDPSEAPAPLAAPPLPTLTGPLATLPVPPLATLPEPPAPEPLPVPSDVARPRTPSQPQPMPFAPGTLVISGSGVVIDDGRHIITHRHVVESVGPLYARNGTGYLRQARVLSMSSEDDLALLEIDRPFDDRCAIPLAKLQNPAPGRPVIVMGFPLRSILGDDHPSMTEGIVSKAEGFSNDSRTFQITNKINPGNSGGPVFDRHGQLMGVIVGKMPSQESKESDLEGLNLGIKADRILRFLQGRAGPIAVADSDASPDEDIYRDMLPCVVLVAGEKAEKGKKEQKVAGPISTDPGAGHYLHLPPGYVAKPAAPDSPSAAPDTPL
jgi:tetratricopeptide (TPR) repeat protein